MHPTTSTTKFASVFMTAAAMLAASAGAAPVTASVPVGEGAGRETSGVELGAACDSRGNQAIKVDQIWMQPNPNWSWPSPLQYIPLARGFNAPVIGMWDFGRPRVTHQEFANRVSIGAEMPISGRSPVTSDHATQVAGVLVGGGQRIDSFGAAPSARVRAFDEFNRDLEMIAESQAGMRISNHSYGPLIGWMRDRTNFYGTGKAWIFWGNELSFGAYGPVAQRRDEIMHDFPNHLMVFSAGNESGPDNAGPPAGTSYARFADTRSDGTMVFTSQTQARPRDGWHTNSSGQRTGYGTIANFSTAKNVLTVGGCEDILTYSGPNSVILSVDSSIGPCRDGRIKPDVVANGVNLVAPTAANNTSYTTTFSGTSAAAPTVTGGIALLMELADLRYPDFVSGDRTFVHRGKPMKASTYKAMVIHTAEEAGMSQGPDYKFGYGLVNIKKAAKLIDTDSSGATHTIQELTLDQGATYTLELETIHNMAPEGASTPIQAIDLSRRVTLAWTDPELAALHPEGSGAPALVNDLDVRVTAVNTPTQVHMPWKLNRLSPELAATRGDNAVDNVERIDFVAIANVRYRLTVTHKGTLQQGPQKFSLITTGFRRVEP